MEKYPLTPARVTFVTTHMFRTLRRSVPIRPMTRLSRVMSTARETWSRYVTEPPVGFKDLTDLSSQPRCIDVNYAFSCMVPTAA